MSDIWPDLAGAIARREQVIVRLQDASGQDVARIDGRDITCASDNFFVWHYAHEGEDVCIDGCVVELSEQARRFRHNEFRSATLRNGDTMDLTVRWEVGEYGLVEESW